MLGASKNLRRRLRDQLFRCIGHVFAKKLRDELGSKEGVLEFVKSCSFRIIVVESKEKAELLEKLIIVSLKPKYNG